NIYMDEMGVGDPAQNHANVYTDLLKSVGIYLPDLHTRAYADYPGIIDSAYTLPVFLLAITQFPEDFYPELLGMTLQLEWEAVSLMPIVDGLRAFGIDPHYYVLHVGIDNAASGHGAVAKQAVKIYLDTIRENEGDARMQEVWKRIWTGYVAFGTIGSMGSDLDNQARMGAGLEDQMIAMINVKAPYARRNHRTKKLGPNYINDWFDDPKGLLNELIKSGMVVPGRPDLSPMLNLMGFNGPMYKVFTDKEQDLWRNWIISLNPPPPAPGLHEQMLTLIKKLRERQQGTTGHNVQLQGPDPKNPGKEITMPLHAWFNLNQDPSIPDPEIALMRALKHPANGWIVPHSVVASPFVTSLLAGTNAMAVAFQDMMPDSSGMTYKEVIVKWIEKGCRTEPLVKSTLRSAVDMENRIIPSKPLRKIWGQGRVH
ncbi:MAG TPA: iron-containing redox enzyme family protein, partial [Candidatus Limnocylindria bacterium]|nr:iron-containing redox enzyme family protein [Candidatus Limnocylindria bacterium]